MLIIISTLNVVRMSYFKAWYSKALCGQGEWMQLHKWSYCISNHKRASTDCKQTNSPPRIMLAYAACFPRTETEKKTTFTIYSEMHNSVLTSCKYSTNSTCPSIPTIICSSPKCPPPPLPPCPPSYPPPQKKNPKKTPQKKHQQKQQHTHKLQLDALVQKRTKWKCKLYQTIPSNQIHKNLLLKYHTI